MKQVAIAKWLLITGLSFVFFMLGVWKLTQPFLLIGWIPLWMDGFLGLSKNVWLTIIGVEEVLLAALLLLPKRNIRKIIAILMALQLVFIIIFSIGWNDVGVRDIALLFSVLSLYVLL